MEIKYLQTKKFNKLLKLPRIKKQKKKKKLSLMTDFWNIIKCFRKCNQFKITISALFLEYI